MIYNRQHKPYLGTPLDKHEWERAIDVTKDRLLSEVEAQPNPAPRTDLPTHILQHLARMAKVDKGCAWWSAHLYAALGGGFEGMPQKLADHMNQSKDPT